MLRNLLTEKKVEITLIKTPVMIMDKPRKRKRYVLSKVNIRKNSFSIK